MKKPVTVTITGAAGNIGYALAFRVASGQMLGADQPINLNLLEIPAAAAAVQGVVMELNDCAFPTLNKVTASSEADVRLQGLQFRHAGRRAAARSRHGAQGSVAGERQDFLRAGKGVGRGRQPRRARAGRRQSRQYQFTDRAAQCAVAAAATDSLR